MSLDGATPGCMPRPGCSAAVPASVSRLRGARQPVGRGLDGQAGVDGEVLERSQTDLFERASATSRRCGKTASFRADPASIAHRKALGDALRRESGDELIARPTGISTSSPKAYQQEMVDQRSHGAGPSAAERRAVVAATGTGATVVAAFGLPTTGLDGRPAVELRLWHALDQRRCARFRYYACDDGPTFRLCALAASRRSPRSTNWSPAMTSLARGWCSTVAAPDGQPGAQALVVFCRVSVAHAQDMDGAAEPRPVSGAVRAGRRLPTTPTRPAARTGEVAALVTCDLYNGASTCRSSIRCCSCVPTQGQCSSSNRSAAACVWPGAGELPDPGFRRPASREFPSDRLLSTLTGLSRAQLIETVDKGFGLLPPGCHYPPAAPDPRAGAAQPAQAGAAEQRRLRTELQAHAACVVGPTSGSRASSPSRYDRAWTASIATAGAPAGPPQARRELAGTRRQAARMITSGRRFGDLAPHRRPGANRSPAVFARAGRGLPGAGRARSASAPDARLPGRCAAASEGERRGFPAAGCSITQSKWRSLSSWAKSYERAAACEAGGAGAGGCAALPARRTASADLSALGWLSRAGAPPRPACSRCTSAKGRAAVRDLDKRGAITAHRISGLRDQSGAVSLAVAERGGPQTPAGAAVPGESRQWLAAASFVQQSERRIAPLRAGDAGAADGAAPMSIHW